MEFGGSRGHFRKLRGGGLSREPLGPETVEKIQFYFGSVFLLGGCGFFSFFCFAFYFQIYFEAGGSVFLLGGVEGEMDPGNFCSILQFMESAGVYRFLTQIPTCWITGKVVR